MKTWIWPAIACAALALATAAWPGDVFVGHDEATFLADARAANAAGRLVSAGLANPSGLRYPPLPHQFYQALLLVTGGDVKAMAAVQSLLITASTAAALLWLTRSLRWSPWLAPLPLCSPFFWFYARILWGNPLALPIGATLVAAWAAYLRTRGRGGFCLAAAAAIALPLIHPMMLPLAGVFAAHAVVFHARAFRRHALPLALMFAIAIASNVGYVRGFEWHHLGARTTTPTHASTAARALAFPWLGGELLSGYRFDELFSGNGPTTTQSNSRAVAIAADISVIAFPLVWLGALSIARRRAPESQSPDVADVLGRLCLIALASSSALQLAARLEFFAHYHLGTWPAAVVCLWAGLRTLRRARLDVAVGVALAAALLTVTGWCALEAHRAAAGRANPPYVGGTDGEPWRR